MSEQWTDKERAEAFLEQWEVLARQGMCDELHGGECQRVFKEWKEAGQPVPFPFITARANVDSNGNPALRGGEVATEIENGSISSHELSRMESGLFLLKRSIAFIDQCVMHRDAFTSRDSMAISMKHAVETVEDITSMMSELSRFILVRIQDAQERERGET